LRDGAVTQGIKDSSEEFMGKLRLG
jgi:hypothetical protein